MVEPMCTCQHEEWRHDRNTGRCLAVVRDEAFCTCPTFVADPTEPEPEGE